MRGSRTCTLTNRDLTSEYDGLKFTLLVLVESDTMMNQKRAKIRKF